MIKAGAGIIYWCNPGEKKIYVDLAGEGMGRQICEGLAAGNNDSESKFGNSLSKRSHWPLKSGHFS